jgi:hypothetical protein
MTARSTYQQWSRRILYFFPLQLLVLHLKKNHCCCLVWLVLFGFITKHGGEVRGTLPLPLSRILRPGRLHLLCHHRLRSGGFITAFNLYSYAMHGYRFPFIATISRPFLKFNINNAVIPGLFIATFLILLGTLPVHEGAWKRRPWPFIHLPDSSSGSCSFLAMALLYFTRTNTDIIKMLGSECGGLPPRGTVGGHHRPAARCTTSTPGGAAQSHALAETPTTLREMARGDLPHPAASHHAGAQQCPLRQGIAARCAVAEPHQRMPSSRWCSCSASSPWAPSAIPLLRHPRWGQCVPALHHAHHGHQRALQLAARVDGYGDHAVIVGLNLLSHHTPTRFLYDNHAYGLDYAATPARYDQPTIHAMATDTTPRPSATPKPCCDTLEQWKKSTMRRSPARERHEASLMVINTSGGGLRATLWTLNCLQHADSLLGGGLMERIHAHDRVLRRVDRCQLLPPTLLAQEEQGRAPQRPGRSLMRSPPDMLNPLAFSFVTNDMFVRYRRVHDGP